MAQVVYADQFLTLTVPNAVGQPELLESLRTVQSNRPQPLAPGVPVTVKAEPEALSITVVTAP